MLFSFSGPKILLYRIARGREREEKHTPHQITARKREDDCASPDSVERELMLVLLSIQIQFI
jgi:hypothetical protein